MILYLCSHITLTTQLIKKIQTISLTEDQRLSLEDGYRNGSKPQFRMRCQAMRCQAILLKGTKRSNGEISSILGCTAASVYNWQKRFEADGISGLKTKSAQRRKPILTALDEDSVRKAIENDRQSLRVAKANWEAATGRTVSESTLRRFLKTLVQDI